MSTGVGRPVSGRRGMTVLGKVPKPVNLPSQRLENRGLDPNVEIVPRGSVSWGGTGSPPTSAGPWGSSGQSSSPPVSSGPWAGAPPRPSTAGSSGSATASAGQGTVTTGVPWGGHPPRPSSAGSGTRPSSAGSLRQTQETVAAANAWGPVTARPSSASGVLGQAQPHSPSVRPRSAETRAQGPALTRFAEQTNGPAAPSPAAWGGAGGARKLGEELHQPARFTLTRVDFPTLGSEKNPDLRPQQNKTGGASGDRPASAGERVSLTEERPPSGPIGPYDEPRPTSPGTYGGQERIPEGWRREGRPYGGHPGMADSWHKEGPAPIQPYGGGQPQVADTWRREAGHGAAPGGGPSDDNWRRGGPPVGPYGPPGPGRFQPDPAFMHQQRYPAPGPGPYGRSGGPGPGPGPGGYGRHGDMYGNAAPFGRPGGAPPRPGPPMGPGMYQGPGPYDNYYGPPGPGYGNMDEREMMMLGMNGPPGMYGNYPQGPPVEPYGRYPHGGPGPGPRHMPNNLGINRERNESMGYEGDGYREGPKYKDNANFKDGAGYKDGGAYAKESGVYKDGGRLASYHDPGESRRAGHVMSSNLTSELQRPSSRGGHQGNHRDWGAAASSDEPMDFSKPVFEEDVSSASPGPGNKIAQSEPGVDSGTIQTGSERNHVDHLKIEDSPELPKDKAVDGGEAKDGVTVQAPKSSGISEGEHVQSLKLKEVESGGSVSKIGEDISLLETKDQLAKKVQVSETKDQLAKKIQVSESSESSEKRWGRGQTRDRSFGREHISSPHTAKVVGSKYPVTSSVVPSVSASLRPGLHAGGSSKSRPTTPSVTQGCSTPAAAETLVSEEVASPPVQEKHMQSSDPTSPSGSDGQKSNEKVRILKRVGDPGPESPHSDIVNITDTSSSEISVSSTAAEVPVKDDSTPKSKPLNNHDGEKEWRPKVVPVSDMTTEVSRPSSSANLKQSSSGVPSSGAAAGAAEKVGIDSGNLSNADSYDYEAQRARMKEIAAQRAIQLRKEEDERIKEQKAKALAKLEELNRRSLVPSVSKPEGLPSDEPTEELTAVIVQAEEIEVVVSEVVIEEVQVLETSGSGNGASTPRVRNGRNEHGKRERAGDRKSNGRSREEHRAKMGPGELRELTKARATALPSHVKSEQSFLPLASQQASTTETSVLSPFTGHANHEQQDPGVPPQDTSGSLGTHGQPQIPPKAQEARHRGKQSALRQGPRQPPPSVEPDLPAQGQGAVSDSNDKVGGWPVGASAPLDLDAKDVTLSLGSNVVSSEGVAAARKKKTKNSGRNKQRLEGLTVSTDSTSFVDSNQGWNDSNDSGTEVAKVTPKALTVSGGDDFIKALLPPAVSQRYVGPQDLKSESATSDQPTPVEIAGSDGVSHRSNGEMLIKRPQRKSQIARERRVPARDRGTSQDVRVGDKSHGGEGMIWAPVRSPSGVHPAGSKGVFGADSIPSADAAVEKKEESVVAPQTGRARRAELERYTPKPVVKQQAQQQEEMQQHQLAPSVAQNQGNESANIPVTNEVPQNSTSLSEIKFGSEARQAETSIRQSRSHASWRQRASGSERLSGHKETNQVQQSESVETGGKSHQPSHNSHTQQNYHRSKSQSATSEQSRPGSSHQTREVGRVHPSASASVEEKEPQNLEGPQEGRSSHSHVPGPAPPVIERESKAPQEGVTPYQPPRPGSSQKNRGVESDAQSSHEQVRTHRINISQDSRQHGAPGKFDRDHHGSRERGQGHQQPRSQNFRHDRDQSQVHSGPHQQQRSAPPVQASDPDGASITREQSSLGVGAVQGRSASQSLNEKHQYAEKEQRQTDRVGAHQQPRSPSRQRIRQQAAAHDREQAPAVHSQQQSKYRQPGQEKDHHRDVPNAVHHQQHQRGTSDGHWQQTGVAPPERSHPSIDLGHANENTTRSTSHKSQITPGGSVDKEQLPTLSSSVEHSARSDPQNKLQGPAPNDTQKQPHYQPVSQHQRPQPPVSQGFKVDTAHTSSHWNGERLGSPPTFRGREHGHSRRGRFAGRYSGSGRGGEIEHRREQLSKQRLPIDATGGAVPSQVGG